MFGSRNFTETEQRSLKGDGPGQTQALKGTVHLILHGPTENIKTDTATANSLINRQVDL